MYQGGGCNILSMAGGEDTRQSLRLAATFMANHREWFKTWLKVEVKMLPETESLSIHTWAWTLNNGINGSSGGVVLLLAMLQCMAPALRVIPRVACTGTISLAGQVGHVDGAEAKIKVAHEAGIQRCLVPRAVYDNLASDFIENVTGRRQDGSCMKLMPVENVLEVLTHAMTGERHQLYCCVRAAYRCFRLT